MKRGWIIAAGLVATVAVGVVVVLSIPAASFRRAANELPAAEAEARRRGIPLSLTDPKLHADLADEENAALKLPALITRLQAASKGNADRGKKARDFLGDPTEENRKAAIETIKILDPILDEFVTLSRMKGMRFPRDWGTKSPYELLFPELAHIKSIAQYLSVRAVLGAEAGRFKASLEDVKVALRLSVMVGSVPSFIGGLVRISCEAISARAIERIASTEPNNRPLLAELKQVIRSHQVKEFDILRFIYGEVAMAYTTCIHLRAPGKSETFDLGEEWGVYDPLRRFDEQTVQSGFAARAIQWNFRMLDALAESANFATRYDRLQYAEDVHPRPNHWDATWLMSAIISPMYAEFYAATVAREARLRLTWNLLKGVQQYGAPSNWPEQLNPNIGFMVDPFTESPFLYQKDEKGILLYSPGKDLKDDGGRATKVDRQDEKETTDVTVAFPYRRM